MVLWHLTVHDVSPSYGLWHLCTTLEGGGATVGYQPSNCGAWATVRHLTSSSTRVMTHSDGLLPRNARLWLPVQWMERNRHETYSAHVYSRWFEDNSYIFLLVVEATRVQQCWRTAGWIVYCPLKFITVGKSDMVWGYRGIWEIPAGFVQENRLPAWTGPCVCPAHSKLLSGTAVLQWLVEGRVCWKANQDCSARCEISGVIQHRRHTPCFWNRWS